MPPDAPTPPDADAPPLRAVIASHALTARKSLGQHFLLDLNLTARIARLAAPLDHRHLLEIGPGPGGLTRALLATNAASLTAIELDPRAVTALAPLAADPRLRIIQADARHIDIPSLLPAPRIIVANLPYNVGTPLLIGWLRQAHLFERLVLMFQREVAERICAAPNTASYGRLAVLAQATCQAELCLRLPPSAFVPPPDVHSAVIRLTPHATQPTPQFIAALERLTACAFGQRRKMLRAALKPLGGPALLAEAGIAPERRAETLSIAEFAALATTLLSHTANRPILAARPAAPAAPTATGADMANTSGGDVVAAMFETHAAAEAAQGALTAAGIPATSISLVVAPAPQTPARSEHIWQRIREIFTHDHHHAHIFAEGVERGRTMLFVHATDATTQQTAMHTLEALHPIDLNHRVTEWASQGWSGQHAGMPAHDPVPPLLFADQPDPDHIPATGLVNEPETIRPIGAKLLNPMGIEIPGISQTGSTRVSRYTVT